MKQATNMYKYLRTQTGSFYEVKIIRGNTTYGMDKLKSIRISQALFQDTGPQVGGVNSSKCVVELRETSYNWPRMAQFEVQYRIVSEDEQDKDSWMSFGFFYTDQRKGSKNGTLKIVAYDAMLKTEQSWTDKANLPLNFPITARHAASLLAEAFDIEFEDLQSLDNDTRYIGRNDSDTARDVLKSIAVGCGGNWYVTPAGKFRLVRLINRDISNIPAIAGLAIADITKVNDANTDITPPFIAGVAIVGVSVVGTFAGEQAEEYNIIQVGLSAKSFESNVITSPVTGVEIESSTGNIAFAGSREGYVIKASCSFANSAIASMCLSKVRGYIYTPFEAKSARLDPIAEIGDYAIVDSSACPIITLEWNICKKPTADMSAPFEEEVDHEYTTISEKAKNYKKLVEATKDETRTAIEQSEESIKLYATQTFVDKVTYESELQRLSDQIDGAIETWQGNAVPTLNNLPASEWSTDADKAAHVGDLYLVETSYDGPEAGHYYRFEKNGNTYSWEQLSDTIMTLALNQAIAAADAAERATLLAEGLENTISQKAKVFVKDDNHANPTPPYYVGDLWITGDSILTCIRTRESGSFNSTDWQKKDTYVDSSSLDSTVTEKVTAALEVTATSIKASVEDEIKDNLANDFLKTEGGIKSSFGWELTSTEHAWYANGKKVMSVDANGLAVKGEIHATSGYIGTADNGFIITSSSIRKVMESLGDTEHDGVYIGTDGIALGAGNFKVTSAGAATMKNLQVTGGSISIGQYVDGEGNTQPTFYVSPDGSLYAENGVFNGTIYASNIVGAVSEQQLADAIQSAISAARNYAAVTATQLAPSTTIPPYFRAGQIVARESFYSDNYYVDTGNDSTEFDLANHYHNITANENTGVVTIGAPVKNSGTPPSFNIAATSFYQNNVAAARTSGANDAKANHITWTPITPASYSNIIATHGDVQTYGNSNNKYIQVQFELTADHLINGNESTYAYTIPNDSITSPATFNVDVTDLVSGISSLRIYTPYDADNPNPPRYDTEDYFTIEANGNADNFIRVFYESDNTRYSVYYELNSKDAHDVYELFELEKSSGGSSGIDIDDISFSNLTGVSYLNPASDSLSPVYVGTANTQYLTASDGKSARVQGGVSVTLSDGSHTRQKTIIVEMSVGEVPSSGTTITSTDVHRVYSGNRPAEATTPDSGETWYISVKPVVNNTEYAAVPLDVSDVYSKGYNANPGTVGAWNATPGAEGTSYLGEDTITFSDSNVSYSNGYLEGTLEIGHGTYRKYYNVRVATDDVPTGGDTPSSGSYARTGQNFYVDEQSYDYGYSYDRSNSKVAITGYVDVDGHRVWVNSFDIGVGSIWYDGYQTGGGGSSKEVDYVINYPGELHSGQYGSKHLDLTTRVWYTDGTYDDYPSGVDFYV